jgi:hypothetical protein
MVRLVRNTHRGRESERSEEVTMKLSLAFLPLILSAPGHQVPAPIAPDGGGGAPAPLSAARGLIRTLEVVADSGSVACEVRGVLAEVQRDSQGTDHVAVTLDLAVHAADEVSARKTFESLAARVATCPWAGEEEFVDYARVQQLFFEGESARRWTPGRDSKELGGEAFDGFQSLAVDARDLLPMDPGEVQEQEVEPGAIEPFVRSLAGNDPIQIGRVEIQERSEPSTGKHVMDIRPLRPVHRSQIGNFLYKLDDPKAGSRVTRVEIRPAEGGPDRWSLATEISVRARR